MIKNMEEYEDKYKVIYFDYQLNKKSEIVEASSKEAAFNKVKAMKGLRIKFIIKVINISKSGLTDERYKKHKEILGKRNMR